MHGELWKKVQKLVCWVCVGLWAEVDNLKWHPAEKQRRAVGQNCCALAKSCFLLYVLWLVERLRGNNFGADPKKFINVDFWVQVCVDTWMVKRIGAALREWVKPNQKTTKISVFHIFEVIFLLSFLPHLGRQSNSAFCYFRAAQRALLVWILCSASVLLPCPSPIRGNLCYWPQQCVSCHGAVLSSPIYWYYSCWAAQFIDIIQLLKQGDSWAAVCEGGVSNPQGWCSGVCSGKGNCDFFGTLQIFIPGWEQVFEGSCVWAICQRWMCCWNPSLRLWGWREGASVSSFWF